MRRVILLAACCGAPLAAQEPPDPAQMALMMELAKPGPEHERLAALAGDWHVEVRMPSAGMAIPGRAANRMILGGRFLTTEVTGEVAGEPFETLTVIGYDRGPGVYTAVGFDTFGTFYVTGAGPWDEAGRRAVLTGSYADPVTGHAHDYEFLFAIHSTDHFTWTVVFLEGEARSVAAEIEYRRR